MGNFLHKQTLCGRCVYTIQHGFALETKVQRQTLSFHIEEWVCFLLITTWQGICIVQGPTCAMINAGKADVLFAIWSNFSILI